MSDITVIIETPSGQQRFPLQQERVSIGRGQAADISIDDPLLARLQASIYCRGDKLWFIDESAQSVCRINGQAVPVEGRLLAPSDRVLLSKNSSLCVEVVGQTRSQANNLTWIAGIMLIATLIVGIAVLKIFSVDRDTQTRDTRQIVVNKPDNSLPDDSNDIKSTEDPPVISTPLPTPSPTIDRETNNRTTRKYYWQMSEAEKLEFIDERAQHIALMMGNRSYVFTADVLSYIKKYVDGYAQRANSNSTRLWGEGLHSLYGRATDYAPHIITEFNKRGVPPVVGLYIVMIETEYHDCLESPVGAKGLFQFMPETARGYGVDPAERCNVKKMSPAAAHYMADRIAEFGGDAMSVALAIAGYNRSPDSVRRDLHDVLDSENRERSFWVLVANSTKLDRAFQNENIKYVPKFFAAAIIGETPWAFGLSINPVSTYTDISASRLQ